jgi:hypothetical protein
MYYRNKHRKEKEILPALETLAKEENYLIEQFWNDYTKIISN